MVLGVEFVRRALRRHAARLARLNRFNRFINGVQTPVIPRCITAAERDDPNAQCSNGAITFWTPGGRERYNALLVQARQALLEPLPVRRLVRAHRSQDRQQHPGLGPNLDNYFESYGPTGARHLLNVSALFDLPWNVQIGIISAMSSRGPVMPTIANVDLDGDGIDDDADSGRRLQLLQLRLQRGGSDGGRRRVQPAVRRSARRAQPADPAARALPADFEFGDSFSSQDVRVTKTFALPGGNNTKLAVFVEVFNIFNVANLGGYSYNLSNTATFGQPTNRASQVFGSGGPRAFQLGGRFTF